MTRNLAPGAAIVVLLHLITQTKAASNYLMRPDTGSAGLLDHFKQLCEKFEHQDVYENLQNTNANLAVCIQKATAMVKTSGSLLDSICKYSESYLRCLDTYVARIELCMTHASSNKVTAMYKSMFQHLCVTRRSEINAVFTPNTAACIVSSRHALNGCKFQFYHSVVIKKEKDDDCKILGGQQRCFSTALQKCGKGVVDEISGFFDHVGSTVRCPALSGSTQATHVFLTQPVAMFFLVFLHVVTQARFSVWCFS